MSINEHGNCPSCGVSFDGGSIWDHFFKEFQTTGYWCDENDRYIEERRILDPDEAAIIADKVAKSYGATRTHGRWGRQIGIEGDRDRIEWWQCPDCDHRWPR